MPVAPRMPGEPDAGQPYGSSLISIFIDVVYNICHSLSIKKEIPAKTLVGHLGVCEGWLNVEF
jgi:hypothetical protein